ncbi:hypothetical protein EON82_06785 [bacterium]|nr:MAG: hypothetical protein EON82_06785 [bacterium]
MGRLSLSSPLFLASFALCAGRSSTDDAYEHRYPFDEGAGSVAVDAAGTAPGALGPDAGRTSGGAIRLHGNARSYVSWERLLGQFGTEDFAVSFRLRMGHGRELQEVLGNRSSFGHGNFFQVRVNEGMVVAEIDQDEEGTNYAAAVSRTRVNDERWHQVRVVRRGRRLTVRIDGKLESMGEGRGVANVRNDAPFRAGTSAVAETYGGFLQGDLDDLVVASP